MKTLLTVQKTQEIKLENPLNIHTLLNIALIKKSSWYLWRKLKMDLRIFEKQNQFVTFQLPYYHAKIKMQNFSIGKSFWSRKVLLGPLIEGTKLVVLEEIGFENLYLIIGTNFGIFGRSRIGSENHTHWESSPGAETKAFLKTKKTAPSPFNSNLGGSRVWQNTKLLKNSKRSSIHFCRGILSKKYTATKTKPLIYWSNFVSAKSNRLHSRSLLLVFRAKDWQKFHMAY